MVDDWFEIKKRYLVKETIGSGGFGKVKRALHIATTETVAIKVMDKAKLGADLPRVKTEIKALRTLQHPHICRLYEEIETENKIFLVLEHCSGGELFDYIVEKDRLNEDEARQFFREICAAVAYMHSKGFAHRDLKPENILIDEDHRIKLIDFGLCANPDAGIESALATCCGSPAYAAPELVSGRKYIGPEADVWSLGVLLYALLNGFLPFDDDNMPTLYKKIKSGKYDEPEWLSSESKFLLATLLQVDPKKRITMRRLLSHRWLIKDHLAPVDPTSKYDDKTLDEELLTNIAIGLGWQRAEMRQELVQWKFDALTATYLLVGYLQLRRSQGKTGKIIDTVPLKDFLKGEIEKENQPVSSSTHIQRQKKITRRAVVPKDLRQQLQSSPCKNYRQPLTPQKPSRKADKNYHEVYSSSDSLDIDDILATPLKSEEEFNFQSPEPFRIRTNRGNRAHWMSPIKNQKDYCEESAPNTMLSPDRRTRSYDCNLDQIRMGAEPLTPSKKGRGIFGSLEKGIDQVRLLLTPNKKKNKDSEPRKIKAVSNVSRLTKQEPKLVLKTIHEVVSKMGVPNRVKGWVVRVQNRDNMGRIQLDFELEVCRLGGRALTSDASCGVRRHRIKGDAMLYKRMAEDILSKVLV
ncbi:unnamed protein product [Oikopleura dioica]|uniref:Maternal embryonic leucine zipper kinase n=1 Tax=Oikopleura dioica TaxID=34765 RepID=E4YBN6_OIKDI|nr:unnamed protein product [Oikopleura dioica]